MTTPKYSDSGYLGHIFSMDVAWKLLQDVEDPLGLPGDGLARLEPLVVDHDPLVVVRSTVVPDHNSNLSLLNMFSAHLLKISVQVSPSSASLLATVALTPSSTEPSGLTNCHRSLLLLPERGFSQSLIIRSL